MTTISSFIYCEDAKGYGDKLVLESPLNIITPAFVPGMYSFSIACGLLGIDTVNEEHILEVDFSLDGFEDKPLVRTGQINLRAHESDNDMKLPPEMKGFFFNMDFKNVVFRESGLYKTIVYLDGRILGEFPIRVMGRE